MNTVGLWDVGMSSTRMPGVQRYFVDVGHRELEIPSSIDEFTERIWFLRKRFIEQLGNTAAFIKRFASDATIRSGLVPLFPFRFKLDGKFPTGVLSTASLWELLLVTTFADIVRGFHFQQCERPDCEVTFPVETDHKRKYCCQYCGHLESMRKQRREEKKHAKKR
jgi:hypothetical protein